MTWDPLAEPDFHIDGIPFAICTPPNHSGPDAAFGQDASRLTIKYLVPWLLRYDAKEALLGKVEYRQASIHDANSGYLSRRLPHTPIFDEAWTGWMYALVVNKITGVTCTGQAALGGPEFVFAELTVTYEPRPYEILRDDQIVHGGYVDESYLERWVERETEDASRLLVTRHGSYKWEDNGKAVGQGVALPLTESKLHYTWHQVPYANWDRNAAEDLLNKCNSDKFDGRIAERMVLIGIKPTKTRLPDGTRGVNIRYTFQHYPQGCNKFPDGNRGNRFFGVVASDGSGAKPFTGGDMRALFRPKAAS